MDTLRDESCPVCGEQDAWDGNECKVCGFVAPPSKFDDPDVDMHKQLDLRQDDAPGGGDVNDLNADINDADGDGLDDNTGEPITDEDEAGADDVQPVLTCPACGTEFEAGHPVSTNTADPQAGNAGADGPAEGDLCPACGKALLETGTQLAEQGEAPPEDGEDVPDPEDAQAQADPDVDPDADPRDDSGGKPFPPDDSDPDEEDDDDAEDDDAADPAADQSVRGKPVRKGPPPGKR